MLYSSVILGGKLKTGGGTFSSLPVINKNRPRENHETNPPAVCFRSSPTDELQTELYRSLRIGNA